jgi:signal transduction histidine kinase
MNHFILAPLFGAAVNLIVAIFVFLRNTRQRLNQIYFCWGLSLAVWCGAASAMFYVTTQRAAEFWARVVHLGVIWIPVTGLHVCLLVSASRARRFLRLSYAVTVLLTIAVFFNLHIRGVIHLSYGWFAAAGPGFWIFSVVMPCVTIPAIVTLIRRRHEVPGEQKKKFTTLIAANSLLLITGSHDLAPVLGWAHYPGTSITIYPWATYAAGFYGFLVAYGVLQNQALDVRVTLSRHAAIFVRIAFFFALAFLLLFIAASVGPAAGFSFYAFTSSLAVLVLAATITGILFPKLFGGTTELLERRLLGDHFEYQEQIQALADRLHRHTNLAEMWQRTAETLTEGMKIAPVHCLLLGARKFAVGFRGTSPVNHVTAEQCQTLGAECAIFRHFNTRRRRMLDVKNPPERQVRRREEPLDDEARAEAERLGAEYVFPLTGTDRVFGFLAVGPKKNGQPFTTVDVELLSRLAQRMGWATERTILASQVALAEKHELLSIMSRGLAHDLNNMLTPVSTVVQIFSQRVPAGSTEGRLLSAAETSLRVVANYLKEAIVFAQDLRPRMRPIELDFLLQEVVPIVEQRAKRRSVKLDWQPGPGELVADDILVQRMIGNLVSNAIDASSPGMTVKVTATADRQRGVVRFTVADTGQGIEPDRIPLVFQPYYTTKDAGERGEERGFGLGLSVCQLVVELHQGAISISSNVGRGTTATVELPMEGTVQPATVPAHHPI